MIVVISSETKPNLHKLFIVMYCNVLKCFFCFRKKEEKKLFYLHSGYLAHQPEGHRQEGVESVAAVAAESSTS